MNQRAADFPGEGTKQITEESPAPGIHCRHGPGHAAGRTLCARNAQRSRKIGMYPAQLHLYALDPAQAGTQPRALTRGACRRLVPPAWRPRLIRGVVAFSALDACIPGDRIFRLQEHVAGPHRSGSARPWSRRSNRPPLSRWCPRSGTGSCHEGTCSGHELVLPRIHGGRISGFR